MTKQVKCCICKQPFLSTSSIHNASPVMDGYCCTICNYTIVIPMRKILAKGETNKEKEDEK